MPSRGKAKGLLKLVGGPFTCWATGKGMYPRESWGFHKPRRGHTDFRADWSAQEGVHHPGFLLARAILVRTLWAQ